MRWWVAFFPVALAACGSGDTDAPEQAPETAITEPTTPTIPPPRREEFSEAWAQACPDAEPANKGLCKSKGFGDPDFTCDFALGDGEYRRYTAELTQSDGEWVLADPENACRAGE